MTGASDKNQCIMQLQKMVDLRLQMQLNDMQASEFDDLIKMKFLHDAGTFDREGRPI